MKLFQPWGRQRLAFLLEKAASREARMWTVYVPKKPSSQDADVSPAQRDEAVRWLTALHSDLRLYPETLALAVSVLDRFLAPIKARPKYLRCIAIACFFLAAKTCEEDECVPSLKELAASSECGCSPSEILRMERIILDKLNWDLHTATALDFLHIFHAMVVSCRSGFLDSSSGLNPSQHLARLTQRLNICLADHTLLQIDSSELIRSRELVARSLSTPRASLPPNTVYIYQPLQNPVPTRQLGTLGASVQPQAAAEEERSDSCPTLLPPRRPNRLQKVTLRCKASTKRKVEQMDVDDFYDGIKRLYNEDAAVQEGASSPCPPLQRVGPS
ncbi:cyclin-I isoform X2 [Nematolebias whitei]|uniref:cyclin-I isoform X2 n=1 Tax=Nematolebias whitei TaxID=451745 RepID=UPI0018979D20|nr:cyclin-I isoform X2 [Nematolebias whitei]